MNRIVLKNGLVLTRRSSQTTAVQETPQVMIFDQSLDGEQRIVTVPTDIGNILYKTLLVEAKAALKPPTE
jgi:hypothetical protein